MKRTLKYQGWILYGAIYMVFLLAHMIILKDIEGVWIYPDSIGYYGTILAPPSPVNSHLVGVRPSVVVLFYKLFGTHKFESYITTTFVQDDMPLLYAQAVTSLVAFSLLAFACAKTAQTRKGHLSLFILPLLFSFIPSVIRWNFTARSESLSISLFVVFVAVWILFLQTKHLSLLVSVALVALLWAGVRDTNAYVLVMIALAIMAALVRAFQFKKSMMMICIWFVCIFSLSDYSANIGSRWVNSFHNNILIRILPVPEHVSFFTDHGMPINPDLMIHSYKQATGDDFAFYKNPNLEKFRAWSLEHGKITYIKFLVTHFTYTIAAPIVEVSLNFLKFVYAFHLNPSKGMYVKVPPSQWPIALIYFLIGYTLTFYYAFVWWRRKWLYRCPYLAVPLVMVLLSAPHAWLTWHGDAVGIVRHTISAYIQFQMGLVLLLLYVWDHGRATGRMDSARKPADRMNECVNRKKPRPGA